MQSVTSKSSLLSKLFATIFLGAGLWACANPAWAASAETAPGATRPGEIWKDNRGQHIQSHGGGVIQLGDTFYWFGEDRSRNNDPGLRYAACYSSKNLVDWTFRNQVVKLADPEHLGNGWILERPKVFFNKQSGKFVMYAHIDSGNYRFASVAVFICDKVDGDYRYLKSFRPLGHESRDLGQFIDDDGTAYLIFEDRPNGFHIAKLSDDFLTVEKDVCLIPEHLEGGGLVHYEGLYYVVGSQLTGWNPNPNKYATAKSLTGPWSKFCDIAPPETKTYGSQSTMLLKVTGTNTTTVIFMGDIWKPKTQWDSRYLWMPLQIGGGKMRLPEPKPWTLLPDAAVTVAPLPAARIQSSGHVVYTIDPGKGDDANAPGKPWKTFKPLQNVRLAPGDKVVIQPGAQPETLRLSGEGSAQEPVTVRFLPGTHLIGSEQLLDLPLFISNAMDSEEPRPIAILVDHAKHIRFEGAGPDKALVLFNGRVVQVFNDHAEDIAFSGLTFDLKRPTVSEFRVLEAAGTSASIQIAERSDYAIEDGKLRWKGDWGPGGNCNEVDLKNGRMRRRNAPRGWSARGQDEASATDLGGRRVRLEFPGGDCGLVPDFQYHFQSLLRDRVGVFNDRSKDIAFRDCRFHALTGMGLVSQFTDNVTFQRVDIAPPAGTIRTHVAWADIFHFSNCRGEILIDSCRLSGMQDDAMNVHGTHLAIAGKPADNQLLLTYQHRQTYGFAPYLPGDEMAVVNGRTLREYPGNPSGKVVAVERKTARNWLVTLAGPVPSFQPNDVVDNVTWHPNVTARNNHISVDAVRGFLLTSRGKMVIEGNTFQRCTMSALLLEDDTHGWCESGPIHDLLITHNRFVDCGIWANPQTPSSDPKEWVHENIRIVDNFFDGGGISARSVHGLTIADNRSPAGVIPMKIQPSCTEVTIKDNERVEPNPPIANIVAATPPMGWNSYDSFGDEVVEQEVLDNARYIKEHLMQHGWQYVVVDYRWYDSSPQNNPNGRKDAVLAMDANGRLLPAENRFPSAAGGKGFKPLADQIHAMGLKFGIHVMRGLPRQAVKANTPIEGSDFKVADAANTKNGCNWCPDMFGVDCSKPAGQAYYTALIRLYARWGVDFIKVDDLSNPYSTLEIEAIRKAIDQCGCPIVFSTSPGETPISEADHIQLNANMWRISGDFWDDWHSLRHNFDLLNRWQSRVGPGHWPDADMIPFGHFSKKCPVGGGDRWTRFTKDEQVTLMTLWCIARSPLMLGMNLPGNDPWTLSLVTNDAVLAVNQHSTANRQMFNRDGMVAWVADVPDSRDRYLAVFNAVDVHASNEEKALGVAAKTMKVPVPLADLGFSKSCHVRDLWSGQDLGEFTGDFVPEIRLHGAGLYRASPR